MKKLILSFFTLISVIGTAQNYHAGTPYSNQHDIVPDSLLHYQHYPYTHNTFSLDIFGGPGYDVELIAHGAVSSGGSQGYMKIVSLNNEVSVRFGRLDSVWVPANQNWYVTKVAKPLIAGELINAADATWDNTGLYLTDHSGSGGGNKNVNDFVGGDKYIGLKYEHEDYFNGTLTQYGWIWVRCTTEDSCFVKAYSRSGSPTGLVKQTLSTLKIRPNPSTTGTFYIEGIVGTKTATVQITDLSGKTMNFDFTHRNGGAEVNIEPLPSGVYFLRVTGSDGVTSAKLIKAD